MEDYVDQLKRMPQGEVSKSLSKFAGLLGDRVLSVVREAVEDECRKRSKSPQINLEECSPRSPITSGTMELKQSTIIPTRYSPCCFTLLRDDIVICGTYQLPENKSNKDIRLGSLCIFRGPALILEQECKDGGVFDLRTSSRNEVLVSHTNGTVGRYEIDVNEPSITLVSVIEIGLNMLTSIDCAHVHDIPTRTETLITAVGDSVGTIVVMEDLVVKYFIESNNSHIITDNSVWCVSIVKHFVVNDYLVVAGTDDGALTVYKDGRVLLKDMSAYAGVTCVKVDTINDRIFSGSYDERIRIYHFSVSPLRLSLVNTLHIPASGIWRLRDWFSLEPLLLVAGMYSGVHVLKRDKTFPLNQYEVVSSISWKREHPDETAEDTELIYDVIPVKNGQQVGILVASFYARRVYFMEPKTIN